MALQEINTTENHPAIHADALCARSRQDADLFDNTTRILNELVPLKGASHADVVEYRVEIPMRYAECFAVLADGRKVALADPRRFLGWSGYSARRSLVFRANGLTLEVEVDSKAVERDRSTVRSINLQSAIREQAMRVKKFIGIDGDLLHLPA